jgi:hypothetical protein
VRIGWLALPAILLEVGWLALWALSGALSHSAAFNTAFLENHSAANDVYNAALAVARGVMPALPGAPLSDALGSPGFAAPAVALALALLWLGGAYLLGVMLLDRGMCEHRLAVPLVVGATLVFQLTLLWLPGIFSQDVFSYIAYGRVAAEYGLNPYVWPPSALPHDDVVAWVATVWRTYPAPYGPLWLDVQWLMARIFGQAPIADQALAYRALANALLLGNLGLAWALFGRVGAFAGRRHRTAALAALAWNPLVLFETSANAHNDVLMVTFSLGAVWLCVASRGPVWPSVSFTLGALTKYVSGVGVVWVVLADLSRARSRRLIPLICVAVVNASIVLLVAWPWLELPDSLEPLLAETATVGYVNSLPDNLVLHLVDSVALAPREAARDAARGVQRGVILIGFALYLLYEGRRVWLEGSAESVARASARSILLYVLLVSTSVQTWYFYLPVALALALGWRDRLARVAVSYSLLALPNLYLHYYLRDATPGWIDLIYGVAPLVWLLPGLRAGARSHEPAAVRLSDDEQRAEGNRLAHAVVEQGGR